jgi:hypothetical protein
MSDHDLFTAIRLVEFLLYPAGLLVSFRLRHRTLAEAAAAALIVTVLLFSLFQQAALVLPLPGIVFLPELGGIWTLFLGWKLRKGVKRIFGDLANFLPRRQPVILLFFVLCWGYMGIRAIFLVPHSFDMETFDILSRAAGARVFPSGAGIISAHFSGSGSRLGAGLPGFFAYTSLLFSTYALSRRYAWVPVSFTVTVVVGSMPWFVFHGVTPGGEILPAAVALFFLLTVYRLIETPTSLDFCLAGACLGFLFSHGNGAFVFSLVMAALFCILLIRRHGFSPKALARHHWKTAVASMVPALIFSRFWTGIPAVFGGVEKNREGLAGAGAGFLGYVISSLDVPFLLDMVEAGPKVSSALLGFLENIWFSAASVLIPPRRFSAGLRPFPERGSRGDMVWAFGFFSCSAGRRDCPVPGSETTQSLGSGPFRVCLPCVSDSGATPGKCRLFFIFLCAGRIFHGVSSAPLASGPQGETRTADHLPPDSCPLVPGAVGWAASFQMLQAFFS